MHRGNWKRSSLEDRNGEHDLHHDDDDDQLVHRWQPSNPPHLPPSTDQPRLITFKQPRVWEMVIYCHHEVCWSFFHAKCCVESLGHVDQDLWLKSNNGSLVWEIVSIALFHLGGQLLCPSPVLSQPREKG
jgi:hypothetical protein